MKNILKWLDDYFEAIFMVILLFSMSIIIVMQVFMRYVMQAALPWSEEIARYMFIYLMYLGISYGVRRNRHLRVSAFVNLFKGKGKKILVLVSDLLFLVFAIMVVMKSSDVVALQRKLGQITAATEMPMSVVYMGVPIGFSLAIIRLIQNIFYKITHFNETFESFNNRDYSEKNTAAEEPAQQSEYTPDLQEADA